MVMVALLENPVLFVLLFFLLGLLCNSFQKMDLLYTFQSLFQRQYLTECHDTKGYRE